MLHVRDMLPPVPEIVDEQEWEYIETGPPEPVYERDADTGVLVRTGESVARRRAVLRSTGRKVDTGSKKATDLVCHDCGAELVPADFGAVHHLMCARLNFPPRDTQPTITSRRLPYRSAGGIEWRPVDSETPYTDCVLECGNWNPEP